MARRPLLVAGLLLVALSLSSTVAGAQTVEERLAAAEREADAAAAEVAALDARAAEVADQLLALRTRVADEQAMLRTLEGRLDLASQELAARRDNLVTAEAQEDVARAALDAAENELDDQAALLSDRAAVAYMLGADPTPAFVIELLRSAASPSDLAVGLELLEAATGYQGQVVRDVAALRARRVELAGQARTTRRAAEDARSAADEAVAFAAETRDQQATVTDRLAEAEAEQAGLLATLGQDADRARVVLASVEAEVARAEAAVAAAAFGPVVPGETCPVVGARAGRDFTNDWGDPRTGGRSHEGTDMFATLGTPVVSVEDGTVLRLRRADISLGGRYVSVRNADGEYWYYAHLDAVAEGLSVGAPIVEGQQLGTVGTSGNARGTSPHLHIGFYTPAAVNPYPTLASRC